MNVNSIINMIIHQITRRLIHHGMDAGVNMLSKMGKGRRRPQHPEEIDEYGNRIDPHHTGKHPDHNRHR